MHGYNHEDSENLVVHSIRTHSIHICFRIIQSVYCYYAIHTTNMLLNFKHKGMGVILGSGQIRALVFVENGRWYKRLTWAVTPLRK